MGWMQLTERTCGDSGKNFTAAFAIILLSSAQDKIFTGKAAFKRLIINTSLKMTDTLEIVQKSTCLSIDGELIILLSPSCPPPNRKAICLKLNGR